jgi:hypothetical protein
MSRDQWVFLFQEHAARHPGIFKLIFRVLTHTLACFLAVWISVNFLGDTYAAVVSLYGTFAVALELAINYANARSRMLWYAVCLTGMVFSGCILVREASQAKASAPNATMVGRPYSGQ